MLDFYKLNSLQFVSALYCLVLLAVVSSDSNAAEQLSDNFHPRDLRRDGDDPERKNKAITCSTPDLVFVVDRSFISDSNFDQTVQPILSLVVVAIKHCLAHGALIEFASTVNVAFDFSNPTLKFQHRLQNYRPGSSLGTDTFLAPALRAARNQFLESGRSIGIRRDLASDAVVFLMLGNNPDDSAEAVIEAGILRNLSVAVVVLRFSDLVNVTGLANPSNFAVRVPDDVVELASLSVAVLQLIGQNRQAEIVPTTETAASSSVTIDKSSTSTVVTAKMAGEQETTTNVLSLTTPDQSETKTSSSATTATGSLYSSTQGSDGETSLSTNTASQSASSLGMSSAQSSAPTAAQSATASTLKSTATQTMTLSSEKTASVTETVTSNNGKSTATSAECLTTTTEGNQASISQTATSGSRSSSTTSVAETSATAETVSSASTSITESQTLTSGTSRGAEETSFTTISVGSTSSQMSGPTSTILAAGQTGITRSTTSPSSTNLFTTTGGVETVTTPVTTRFTTISVGGTSSQLPSQTSTILAAGQTRSTALPASTNLFTTKGGVETVTTPVTNHQSGMSASTTHKPSDDGRVTTQSSPPSPAATTSASTVRGTVNATSSLLPTRSTSSTFTLNDNTAPTLTSSSTTGTSFSPGDYCLTCRNRRNNKDLYANPEDCHSYFQCFYIRENKAIAMLRECPPGTFWREEVLSCLLEGSVPCVDICRSEGVATHGCYASSENCAEFYVCSNAASYQQCCPLGTKFNLASCGCVFEPSCRDVCIARKSSITTPAPNLPVVHGETCTDAFGNILRRSASSAAVFEIIDTSDIWKTRIIAVPCAPGSLFDLMQCRCDFFDNIATSLVHSTRQCHLYLPFDDDFQDHSNSHFQVYGYGSTFLTEDAAIGRGSLFFSGGNLEIPGLKTIDFQGIASWCLFYRCDSGIGTYDCLNSAGLLSNNNNDQNCQFTILIGTLANNKIDAQLRFQHPSSNLSLEVPTDAASGWVQVCVVYDGSFATVYVDGVAANSEPATGALAINHCPYVVGSDQLLGSFNGWVDEVLICDHAMSPDEVEAHYQGDRNYLASRNLIPPQL